MVRWYHLIMSAYGFWLPNDPRGSWSEFVGAWELYKFGPATKVDGRRSYAHDPHDIASRLVAKRSLKYPAVRFDGPQRVAIADGFRRAVLEACYFVHALCIGNDHVHLVVERHARSIETIAKHLKSRSTMALTSAGVHPLAVYRRNGGAVPTPWSAGSWGVFVNSEAHLSDAIDYVRRHPMKEGLPAQEWDFVGVRTS